MTEDFISRARYEREVTAREAAERLLEQKSHDLYRLNVELLSKSDSLAIEVQERTRELSKALEAAQAATRAKDLFLANMSHEVRTPLTGILGVAQLLAESDLSQEQHELLDNLQASCSTLKNIIDDLLDLKSLERGRVQFRLYPFDPVEVIDSLVARYEPVATSSGNRLVHVTSLSSSRLRMGDRTRFEQVVANLLTNALKFTQNGTIEIKSCISDSDVTVVVSDSGIGMQSDQLERIFEDFTQADSQIAARYGGTGLGLSIVRMIMSQLGGSIHVTSKPDEGSSFTAVFPIVAASSEDFLVRPGGVVHTPSMSLQGKRILLAEDNRINAKVIRTFVAKHHGETTLATGGLEALGKAASEKYDLMIFDINMPDIGGVELLHRIRTSRACAINSETPALACTANAMPDQIANYIESGFSSVIRKPFEAHEFIAGVAAGLAAK
ncbi:MAG: ATP-binding protein [Planctomycetota bacterium]